MLLSPPGTWVLYISAYNFQSESVQITTRLLKIQTFCFQAFNTFIDDVFAFIITMPTAHRVACFRDDVVFIIYLYQRWWVFSIYPSAQCNGDVIIYYDVSSQNMTWILIWRHGWLNTQNKSVQSSSYNYLTKTTYTNLLCLGPDPSQKAIKNGLMYVSPFFAS